MVAIATLRLAQSREIELKIFLGGYRSSRLFWSPDHNSSEFYLIIHSDQTTKLSKAWVVTFLFLPAFLHEGHTSPDTFFSLTFIKERILSKIICHSVTKGRRYVCRWGLLHFNSPDLNSEHLRLSAQGFISLVSLCSCIRMEKKVVFPLP